MTRSAALCLLLVAAAVTATTSPGEVSAQSVLGFRALGTSISALDARAVALGNLGVGLDRVEVSATDPTAGARTRAPTVSLTMQPTWGEFEIGDETGTTQHTRFPLVGIDYPVLAARGAVTLTFAGYMEQRWVGKRLSTVSLGGTDVSVDDTFEVSGGASVARLGWSQQIGERLTLGFTAGTYVGRLTQSFDRTLDSLAVGGEVQSFVEEKSWQYGGPTLTLGLAVDPHELVHLAGALEWSGNLTAEPQNETEGPVRAYGVPLRLSAGVTGRLTSRLSINSSFVFQDWSDASGFVAGVTSERKLSFGTGLEWRALQSELRSVPIRIGYRRLAQPFRYASEDPVESVLAVGLGVNLVELEGTRLGWMDMSIERGTQSSDPLQEKFWRATLSLGISRL